MSAPAGASLPMPGDAGALAVAMHGIDKSFGPVRANRAASLDVARGEIHALVGENGAGKSTLMRVLSGMYAPSAGTVIVNGRDVTGWTTAKAIAAGVGMVHQHFMLVPTLTVAENVVLGREITLAGQLDRGAAEQAVADLGARTGLLVAPNRKVSDLSVGEAQRVEILKTLYRGARILILDEPTAVLSPPEVEELWRVLARMRDAGDTIILITHKLDEVMEISNTVTVMRHGQTVATRGDYRHLAGPVGANDGGPRRRPGRRSRWGARAHGERGRSAPRAGSAGSDRGRPSESARRGRRELLRCPG